MTETEENKYREIKKMAGVERFELPTVGFGDRCSTNWNYTPATGEALYPCNIKGKVLFAKYCLFD